jgi:hypothetical protein
LLLGVAEVLQRLHYRLDVMLLCMLGGGMWPIR